MWLQPPLTAYLVTSTAGWCGWQCYLCLSTHHEKTSNAVCHTSPCHSTPRRSQRCCYLGAQSPLCWSVLPEHTSRRLPLVHIQCVRCGRPLRHRRGSGGSDSIPVLGDTAGLRHTHTHTRSLSTGRQLLNECSTPQQSSSTLFVSCVAVKTPPPPLLTDVRLISTWWSRFGGKPTLIHLPFTHFYSGLRAAHVNAHSAVTSRVRVCSYGDSSMTRLANFMPFFHWQDSARCSLIK